MTIETGTTTRSIIGEPEVVEDATIARGVEHDPAWRALKDAATTLQTIQASPTPPTSGRQSLDWSSPSVRTTPPTEA